MRVAIIGYGYMGQIYADLIKSQNWQLVGVHDTDPLKWKTDNFFKDRLDLIANATVDTVIICTPHHEHLPILKECLKHRKNVILEKPMGSTEEESKKIYKKIQKYKQSSLVIVNITHCFYKNIRLAKQELRKLFIGDIRSIFDSVIFPIKKEERDWWLFKKASVGHGVMLTNGCHLLARILFLFSEYRPTLEVVGGVFGNTNKLGDIDDTSAHMRVDLVLSNQQRIPLSIFANWPMATTSNEQIQESMEIHTSEKTLHVQAWKGIKLYPKPVSSLPRQVPFDRTTIGGEIEKGVQNVLLVFEEAVANKQKEVHFSVEYTYQAEQAIAAFYSKFQSHAYDARNHSPLLKAMDLFPPGKEARKDKKSPPRYRNSK